MLVRAQPESWLWLLLTVLAVWRCAVLVTYESGPFRLMVRVRRILYRGGLRTLVDCFDCTAIWIGAAAVAAVYRPGWSWLVLIPAVAGGASLLDRLASGGDVDDVDLTEE